MKIALLLLITLATALSGAEPALATSSYDGVISLSPNLEVGCLQSGGSYTNKMDVTTNWTSILDGTNTTGRAVGTTVTGYSTVSGGLATAVSRLNTAVGNGTGWSVAQISSQNNFEPWRGFRVVVMQDSTNSGSFVTSGSNKYLRTQTNKGFSIVDVSCSNQGGADKWDIFTRNFQDGDGVNAVLANESTDTSNGEWFKPLFINIPITYPSGYEGVSIPDSLVSFDGFVKYTIVDKLASFELKDMPEGSVECKLYVDTNKAVDPDDAIEETFYQWSSCDSRDKVTHAWKEYGTYEVRLEVTDEGDNITQFTRSFNVDGSSYDGGFGLDEDDDTGGVVSDPNGILSDCFSDTFPFVNVESCVENFKIVGNLLSFGVINWGQKLDATPCKNLSVVDEWMNLESPEVCPMVPAGVRTIVTPFVSFALGLMMIRWLSNQSGGY